MTLIKQHAQHAQHAHYLIEFAIRQEPKIYMVQEGPLPRTETEALTQIEELFAFWGNNLSDLYITRGGLNCLSQDVTDELMHRYIQEALEHDQYPGTYPELLDKWGMDDASYEQMMDREYARLEEEAHEHSERNRLQGGKA